MNNSEWQQLSSINPEDLEESERRFEKIEEYGINVSKQIQQKLKEQNFGYFKSNEGEFGKFGKIESNEGEFGKFENIKLNLRKEIESIIGRKPILEITQELIENGIPINNNISVAGSIAFVLIDLRKMGLDNNPGIANLRSRVSKDIFLYACNEAMYGRLEGDLAYDYITKRCDYLMKK